MVKLLRSIFVAAATALVMAPATPTLADEYVTNLGPVGPSKPILADFSGQRFLAFLCPS
jgi:hypothetical protein